MLKHDLVPPDSLSVQGGISHQQYSGAARIEGEGDFEKLTVLKPPASRAATFGLGLTAQF